MKRRVFLRSSRPWLFLEEKGFEIDSYYDNIFKDICIFADFNDENNIKEIIKNYKFKDCILNKEKLIKKLNYVNIISKNINLF